MSTTQVNTNEVLDSIDKICALAVKMHPGNAQEAISWLNKPNIKLAGASPFEYCITSNGKIDLTLLGKAAMAVQGKKAS